MPKTSEQWLEEAAPKNKQTVFKLFLGYAPGAAKTFNMLMSGFSLKWRSDVLR
jgi:K+-sensing histidine kinase KdpD